MGTPLHVVALCEARELLSVLRRNRRFGYSFFAATSQPSEHPFVKEIKLLRDSILEHQKNSSGAGAGPETANVPTDSPQPSTPLSPRNATTSTPDVEHLVTDAALRRILEPFLHVVTSRDASGLITGVALQCIERIVSCLFHLISFKSDETLWKEYVPTLNLVVDSIAACRFDVTDPAADEVVLSRITTVISRIATSQVAYHMSDASLLRGIEACLGIASGRRRASELLRRSAEYALCNITNSLGKCTRKIASSPSANGATTANMDTIVKTLSFDASASSSNGAAYTQTFSTEGFDESGPLSGTIVAAVILVVCRMAESPTSSSFEERILGLQMLSSLLSFGGQDLMRIPSVRDVLLRDCSRVVLRCLGSFKSSPTEIATSFTAARLLVHALGSECVGFLAALLEDVYPCYVTGYENAKVASALDSTQGTSSTGFTEGGATNGVGHSAAISGDIASMLAVELDPVVREVGLESLADLVATPGLLSSLYAVVDCDIKCEDVVGPLLRALGKASMSGRPRKRSKRLRASSSGSARVPGTLSSAESDEEDGSTIAGGGSESSRFGRSSAVLCAEAVLTIVRTIAERLDSQAELVLPNLNGGSPTTVGDRRRMKKEKVGAQRIAMAFNEQPKINRGEKLIAFLKENKQGRSADLGDTVQEELDNNVSECVKFLRETRGLNKEMVGAILGEPDDISRRILASFTATFNFRNRRFTDCIRVYLESFRLPGEAQKIDRIVECFSNSYYAQNRSPVDQEGVGNSDSSVVGLFKNADAVYTLTFSTVMLNTDQHNDNIKRKMNLDQFVSNNKGTNNGEDFPRWFLEEIFDSIASAEIKMKGEAGMDAITSAHWDEYIEDMRVRRRHLLAPSEANNFDEDIFMQCWMSAVAAANVLLIEAGDENQAQKALEGFVSVARCGTAFHQSRPVDTVVTSLVNASNLRDGPLHGAVFRFGTDIKAQMAVVVLSDVIRQCGDFLRSNGWHALVSYLLRLHALNLLPEEVEKTLGGNGNDLHVHGIPLPKSKLVPSWWPSQDSEKTENESDEEEKSRKPSRTKGIFAAFFAASIGSGASSDDEAYGESETKWAGTKSIKISNTPPSYLRPKTNEEMVAQNLAKKCITRCRVEDILIDDCKILRSDALLCLTKAIARTAGRILDASGLFPNGSKQEQSGDSIGETEPFESENEAVKPENGHSEPLPIDTHMVNLAEFAPSSPRDDSSAIVGVSASVRSDSSSVELDSYGFTGNGSWTGASRERDEKKAREFVAAFCIDLLCNLTLQNRDRLNIPWPAFHSVLVRIIAPATKPSALLERAVIALLRVATRLLHRDELHAEVLRTLNLIVQLPDDAFSALSNPIAAGLHNLVKSHGANIASTTGWHAIFSIIESMPRCDANAVDTALKLLSFILVEKSALNAVCPETFAPILAAIMAFATNGSLDASLEALELLGLLSRRIPDIARLRTSACRNPDPEKMDDEVWDEFWGPLLKAFARSARDPRGKVRNEALIALEKVLAMCGTEVLTAKQWKAGLSTVIFPLMKQLFSTHGFLSATIDAERAAQQRLRISTSGNVRTRRTLSAETEEKLLKSVTAACKKTRLRALMLTSKTFLQHHAAIAEGLTTEEFTDLWLGVLEVYRIALLGDTDNTADAEPLASEPDELQEHVPESVKNLMLVLSDCGLLVESETDRWNATFELIQSFLPETVDDIQSLASMSRTSESAEVVKAA